jgi:PAS domain S-box-containing protein
MRNLNSPGLPTRPSILGSGDDLRLVIDTIPVMAWAVLPDGKLEFLNRRWLDYSGLSLQEAIEQPTSTMHPEDLPRVLEEWREHMSSGESYEGEMRLRRADGEYRWFLVRTVPLLDEQGKIVKWYGTSTDIEDRKRAEDAMHRSQQLLNLVLETLPVGVAVTDRAGDIILSNAASRRIWGEQMIQSGVERWARSPGYWHDSGQRISPTQWPSVRALRDGKTTLNELIDIDAFDGRRKTIQASAAPIRAAEGAIVGAVVVIEEVTERVHAEEALRESASRLQHLSRRLIAVQEEERSHLSRELHDEFGQLLATISLHLHAVRSVAGGATETALDEVITLVKRAGAEMRTLALELRPRMLETSGLDATLRWLGDQHSQHTGVSAEVVGHVNDVGVDLAIACFRVLQEALTNVARHAQAQHVRIELAQSDSMLELAVCDDGIGFEVSRILEGAAGRGNLGLAGMRERVEILGGVLKLDSEPGNGTRIRIALPLNAPGTLPPVR